MTLDDLERYKYEFSENFAGFRSIACMTMKAPSEEIYGK